MKNNKVFVVKNKLSNNSYLVVKKSLLEDFSNFEEVFILKLVCEVVHKDWGYDIEDNPPLYEALKSKALNISDYKYHTLIDDINLDYLNKIRLILKSTDKNLTKLNKFEFM